ncbi:hypothetical protein SAMN05444369_102213 [Capnocytophaga haemolytica]|nr:hypothetical protein SAMN05444369_102213 [Capnocytophaga haemolytica]
MLNFTYKKLKNQLNMCHFFSTVKGFYTVFCTFIILIIIVLCCI